MKLLTKTTLYFITVSLFIFFLGGIGFYKLFSTLIDKRVNNELHSLMHNIIGELNREIPDISDVVFLSSERISIRKVDNIEGLAYQFKDTILYDNYEKLYYPYRQLTFYADVNGEKFEFLVYKSLLETNFFVENIALAMTVLFLLFILGIIILNRYLFRKIWSDFFKTIGKIQQYDLDSAGNIDFDDSIIIEFNQLNMVLKKMTRRIQHDYISLKEFTGNISHEIQTPLAIIKSKTELLLQSENLNENQVLLIREIYNGTTRLSKLNQTLILLTKIENHQFHEKSPVNINEIVTAHLLNFDSLLESKKIKLSRTISGRTIATMNFELADVLILNLLKNAIRHNFEGGEINIILNEKSINILNTGIELKIDPAKIFDRFTKESKSKNSLGLGLAIVKKICDYYGFKVEYKFVNNLHNFSIVF